MQLYLVKIETPYGPEYELVKAYTKDAAIEKVIKKHPDYVEIIVKEVIS